MPKKTIRAAAKQRPGNGRTIRAIGGIRDAVVDQIIANRDSFDAEIAPFLSVASLHGEKMVDLFRSDNPLAAPDPRVFLTEAANRTAGAAGALFAYWHASRPLPPEEERRIANQIVGLGRSWRRIKADFAALTAPIAARVDGKRAGKARKK